MITRRFKTILYLFFFILFSALGIALLSICYSPAVKLEDTVLSTVVLKSYSNDSFYGDNGEQIKILNNKYFDFDLFQKQVKPGERVFFRTYKEKNEDNVALSVSVNNHTYLDLQNVITKQNQKNYIVIGMFIILILISVISLIRFLFLIINEYSH